MENLLTLDYFRQEDTTALAKSLLGKTLFTNFNNQLTGGIIIETEAYLGATDRACHAFGNRRTNRTEPMFAAGGIAYVYLCYGMHHLFNIVTHKKDTPHAILIRAIHPTHGIPIMRERRKNRSPLSSGPGTLTQALGITTSHTGLSLTRNQIFLQENPNLVGEIQTTPRIGVDYAGEDAKLPYRFLLKF
ncbi:MAG: DNA-3-methyladenine glycosylase [Candidatus Algichlamydia australiensis]|nr:DNA-3-methyladenine glycosylase [Chlamydiales bacterium]